MDLFSTSALTQTINSLVGVPSHLLDMYFPYVQTEQSEEIHFDVISKTRRLAPFVSPVVAGRIVDAQGFTTNTFKPAYVKPKTPFDPSRPLKRIPGEQIGGMLSPQQRLEYLVGMTLMDHKDMIRRRMEVMAAEALRTGQVTVTGDQYPTVVVNYGRDAALTPAALTSTARWGQSAAKPLDNLQDWSQIVLKKSGAMPVDVTMDVDSWKQFRADAVVIKRLDMVRATGSNLNFGAQIKEGAVFMGNVDGFNIWVYAGWYLDDNGVEQPILPSGTVIMGGSQIEGVQAHGAIRDEEAGYQAIEIYSKSWVEKDPSVRYVMSQSAPLVVPTRVNASLCATVL